jgi:hypothetical protein
MWTTSKFKYKDCKSTLHALVYRHQNALAAIRTEGFLCNPCWLETKVSPHTLYPCWDFTLLKIIWYRSERYAGLSVTSLVQSSLVLASRTLNIFAAHVPCTRNAVEICASYLFSFHPVLKAHTTSPVA